MHEIHIVSGGTGASAEQVVRTVLAQFPDAPVHVVVHAGIRDPKALDEVMRGWQEPHVTVVHTLVSSGLRDQLIRSAQRRGVVEVDLAGGLIERLAWALDRAPAGEPGRYRRLRSEYFARIDAVEFAVEHDDGRKPSGWMEADVLVLGTSRVGKTPLCMYLAAHGWRAANMPLVREVAPPTELFRVPNHKIIGLTIEPARLAEHRNWRARQLSLPAPTKYVDPLEIERDIDEARLFYRRNGIAVVDVTDKPVEEIAQAVMDRVRR